MRLSSGLPSRQYGLISFDDRGSQPTGAIQRVNWIAMCRQASCATLGLKGDQTPNVFRSSNNHTKSGKIEVEVRART